MSFHGCAARSTPAVCCLRTTFSAAESGEPSPDFWLDARAGFFRTIRYVLVRGMHVTSFVGAPPLRRNPTLSVPS